MKDHDPVHTQQQPAFPSASSHSAPSKMTSDVQRDLDLALSLLSAREKAHKQKYISLFTDIDEEPLPIQSSASEGRKHRSRRASAMSSRSARTADRSCRSERTFNRSHRESLKSRNVESRSLSPRAKKETKLVALERPVSVEPSPSHHHKTKKRSSRRSRSPARRVGGRPSNSLLERIDRRIRPRPRSPAGSHSRKQRSSWNPQFDSDLTWTAAHAQTQFADISENTWVAQFDSIR